MLVFSWFMQAFFSLATVSSDWPLRLNSLKRSIYYFNSNIWFKYTGITWQKDKYLMADKKLRIPRKLKIQTHKQAQWFKGRELFIYKDGFPSSRWNLALGAPLCFFFPPNLVESPHEYILDILYLDLCIIIFVRYANWVSVVFFFQLH